MDAYFDESIERAQQALDEASGLLRAQGLDALADRLDDAWCAVRDVKVALREPQARIIVLEGWRCSWCSRRPSGWA
jgi:uncharacterized membrane protein